MTTPISSPRAAAGLPGSPGCTSGAARDDYYSEALGEGVKAAAPLIVAAELRRLAELIRDDARGYEDLLDRAAELDPEGASDG